MSMHSRHLGVPQGHAPTKFFKAPDDVTRKNHRRVLWGSWTSGYLHSYKLQT